MRSRSSSLDSGLYCQDMPSGFKGLGQDFYRLTFEALSEGTFYTLLERLRGELCSQLPLGSLLSEGFIPITHMTQGSTLVSGGGRTSELGWPQCVEVAYAGAVLYSTAQARGVPWTWGGPSACSVVCYTEENSIVRAGSHPVVGDDPAYIPLLTHTAQMSTLLSGNPREHLRVGENPACVKAFPEQCSRLLF